MNSWVICLDSSNFGSQGLPWVYHARRFPGVRLHVADAGLDAAQRKQLLDEQVSLFTITSTSPSDVWAGLLQVSDGTILYTSATDLLVPVEWFSLGGDRMTFTKWSAPVEYYNLCKPLLSIPVQARTANYIESKLVNGFASPVRICGPAYLWKAMVGIANFARGCQPVSKPDTWEPLVVNLFATAYPEYTLLR